MKKQIKSMSFFGSVLFLCASCSVSYIKTDTLKQNYEKKIHHTTLLGKALFKTDQRKKDTYDHVQVFLNESEVKRDFDVTAYGSYTPLILPLVRPERPRLEKYLLWKGARKARKLKADGVIIDNKNDFRVIKFK
ncbi:MAG: hypothetical protein IKN86_10890 [Bacteroidaceae bacterium]|nr:hypothetical protein [Bacteroidaceae bacterium]